MATINKNNTTNRTLSSAGCWENAPDTGIARVPLSTDIARWYSASNAAGAFGGSITVLGVQVDGATADISHTSGTITLGNSGFIQGTSNNRSWLQTSPGVLALNVATQNMYLYNSSGNYAFRITSSGGITGTNLVIHNAAGNNDYLNALFGCAHGHASVTGTVTLQAGTAIIATSTLASGGAFSAANYVIAGNNSALLPDGASTAYIGGTTKSLTINADNLTVGWAGRTLILNFATINFGSAPRTLTVNGNTTIPGAVTGTAGVTVNLASASTFLFLNFTSSGLSGPCTVNTGRFVVGALNSSQSTRYAPSALVVNAGSTFEYLGSDNFNFPSLSSGGAAANPTGTGAIAAVGNYSGTGCTFVAGTLTGFAGLIGTRPISDNAAFTAPRAVVHELPGGFQWVCEATGALTVNAQITYASANAASNSTKLILDSANNTNSAALTGGTYALIVPNTAGAITLTGTVQRTNTAGTASARMSLTLGGSNTGDNTLSGDISEVGTNSAILGITKVDAGRWVLSGANSSHTGVHTISAGTLSAQSEKALGSATSAGGVSVTGTGKLELAGNITLNKSSTAFSIHTNNPITSVGDNTLRTAGVTLNGTTTFQVTDANRLTIDNSSAISGNTFGIIKTGAGELVLNPVSNAYTGAVLVDEGTLTVGSVANSGSPAAWGQGTSVSVTGILNYNGTGHSSNRSVTLAGTSPTIKASGAGPLTLSNITQTSVAKTINLSGASTASNTISSAVTDTSFATSVAKSENGRWELSGALSYTGTTTVSAGVLRVTSTNSNTTSGTVTVDSGAEMELITSTSPAGSGNGRVLGSSNVVVNGKIKTGYSTTQRGQIRFGGNVTFGAGSELNIGAVAA